MEVARWLRSAWPRSRAGGAALAVARLLSTRIYGLSHLEPTVLAGAKLTLAIASLAACCFPTRRVTLVDPIVALRQE